MKEKLNSLIKLLLDFHKKLLDLERGIYEKKNGPISNNHEYFQLVVNHDDFRWLRTLSEIITSLDLESENPELDLNRIKVLSKNIENLFIADNEVDFNKRYRYFCNQDANILELENKILINTLDISK